MSDGNMRVGAGPRHARSRGGRAQLSEGRVPGRVGGRRDSTGRSVGVRLDRSAPQPLTALSLDAQQRAVVEHRDGHLLVLAGPGTGKTATLAELVVARISDAADPIPADRILALTFGRRAARELSDRISGRLGGGPVPVVSTFHSFAYGVLRQHADPTAFASPPRLLVAAEQDARLRELLTYSIEEGRLQWPESLSRAIGTRGIAEQVRALLARARGQGLDGKDLTRIGRARACPVWAALGGFFEEYLATLEFEGSLDYAELILRAAVLANDPRAGRALRGAFRLVVVDEYQDTDPAQVALLRGLAGGGAQVVAVGDPDQAIYGFRGADVRGILRFPDLFAGPTGQPARIEVLRTTRRFPTAIAEAASGVLGPVSLAPLPAEVQRLTGRPGAWTGRRRWRSGRSPAPARRLPGSPRRCCGRTRGRPGAPGSRGRRWPCSCAVRRCTGRSWRVPCARRGSRCGCPRTRPRSPTSRQSACCCRSSDWPWTRRRRRRRLGARCWPDPSGGPTPWPSGLWPGPCSRSIEASGSPAGLSVTAATDARTPSRSAHPTAIQARLAESVR